MARLMTLSRSVWPQILNQACRRAISTSKNTKSDAAAVSNEAIKNALDTEKNWVSYGFEDKSKKDDRQVMHWAMFTSVSLILVWGGFFFMYMPDYMLLDWAQRQAFIELRKREADGLPLVDPDLIPRDRINLPSDEELGDFEIII